MNAKELRQILQALTEHDVAELTLETPDYKLTVKRGKEVILTQAAPLQVTPIQPVSPQPSPLPEAAPPPKAEAAPP